MDRYNKGRFKFKDLKEIAEELKKIIVTDTGCHEYQGKKRTKYRSIRLRGRDYQAHRLSWAIANGGLESLKEGFHICHKCNNPPCINPEHLYQGTPQENAIDCVLEGKARSLKLTPAAVQDIRKTCENDRAQKTLLALTHKYQVSIQCIYSILSRKSWNWLK